MINKKLQDKTLENKRIKNMNKNLKIRNSTAEFLIFTTNTAQDTIEVKIEDDSVWLTQKLIAKLFDVSIATINEHLKNILKPMNSKKVQLLGNS